ncbi:peptide deformylase [Natranaerofaba carboxydovora]|uniref:peptide deformylase n=1 Tax=Natranaerofaba carboxydovora TaxID=2742683 RepID=UPI0024029CC8|nr:peptide deformylase [Natranaerofaba carboxydovora]UMZ73296.1 Peptide deformylase 1 [Natranaerofaba carboxydovora]
MAIKIIRTQDDPVLKESSKPVGEITPRIEKLVKNMLDTMYDAQGVGLAAPQIGISKQVIVIDTREENNNVYKLINPTIVEKKGKMISTEGCLSFPGILGEVERAEEVKVEAMDLNGEKIVIEAKDLLARVLQHEIDHLRGVTLPDIALRIKPEEEIEEDMER